MEGDVSTPVNTVSRENLTVLIMNNMLNNSVEFASDTVYGSDTMETDSPLRKPYQLPQAISKKLFHSPMTDSPTEQVFRPTDRSRKAKKRKQNLVPNSNEKLKKVYVKECERDGYSPEVRGGMRKKVLISLFHNKEYNMDVS